MNFYRISDSKTYEVIAKKDLYRDNFNCEKCGRSPATDPNIELQVDHIKPYSKGGETELNNLFVMNVIKDKVINLLYNYIHNSIQHIGVFPKSQNHASQQKF